ncbi:MAG: hypothetical protein F3745_02920 [Nitrospinae bacterium]|nr:hypothetical protein [Nitrospinota bacterium]
MEPLKIGVIYNQAREIMDHDARLFFTLLNDPKYEVVTVIKDGRSSENEKSFFQKIKISILDGCFLRSLFYRIINLIESPLRKGDGGVSLNIEELKIRISALPCIEMTPERKGYFDIFSKNDCTKIENLDLVILLQHEFGIIRGEFLRTPKYGIWSFHNTENRAHRDTPAGFWEVYNNDSVTGITLQVLGDDQDGGKVIQKGFYNTPEFWYQNLAVILDSSVDLILKHLRLLYENRELKTESNGVYSGMVYMPPSSFQLGKYIFKKYAKVAFRKSRRTIRSLIRADDSKDIYKLHIGKGCIDNAVLWRSKTIEPPNNEFWCDPFLFEYEKQVHVFFENFEFSRQKGKISVGIIGENQINAVKDAIDVNYHMSYPFVFEHNNDIFMIPETYEKKRLEIWKCKGFPSKWSLEKTLFEGISLADSTIAKDKDGEFWLFTNISYTKVTYFSSHLYIFKIDSPMMNEIIPHKLNPVVTDCRSARGAGNIYTDHEGRLIRPSQASQNGVYGECLNLCHVKELTIDSYQEEILETITPKIKNGLYAVHHLSQASGVFVVDGRYTNR